MRLRKIYMVDQPVVRKSQAGFTLFEMIVVMGIITMLGTLSMIVGMDGFRAYTFRSERDMVVVALEKARSQSISNVCIGGGCTDGKPHGVRVANGSYTIFQGASYGARDAAVDETIASQVGGVAVSGAPANEVVFSQLSGNVLLPVTFTLSDGAGHSSVIDVNAEGRIAWTN